MKTMVDRIQRNQNGTVKVWVTIYASSPKTKIVQAESLSEAISEAYRRLIK